MSYVSIVLCYGRLLSLGYWLGQKQSTCENPTRAYSDTMAPDLLTWMCGQILTPSHWQWLTSAGISRIIAVSPSYTGRRGNLFALHWIKYVYYSNLRWGMGLPTGEGVSSPTHMGFLHTHTHTHTHTQSGNMVHSLALTDKMGKHRSYSLAVNQSEWTLRSLTLPGSQSQASSTPTYCVLA